MSLSGRQKVRHFLDKRRKRSLARRKRLVGGMGTHPEQENGEFTSIDFEKHKDQYQKEVQDSISFIGQDLDFFTEVKAGHLVKLARRYLGDPTFLKILDVGCGIGITDRYLVGQFGKVYGVEIAKGLARKAAKLNPKARYRSYDGENLPFPNDSMDVTFAICVLHHVPPTHFNAFVKEMARVTRKGGLVILFEHNPLNPLTLLAVNHCDLDDEAILIRRWKTGRLIDRRCSEILEKKYILFTPFRGSFFTLLDRLLGWLPLGAQYYVAGKK
ncbi:MAG TPA: class I SAM-dependent methyltransferase [bacterium]